MPLAVRRLVLLVATALFLAPVLWLISTAYKTAADIFSRPPSLGFTPTLANFRTLFGYLDVPQLALSSLTISLGATLLALLLGVPAGYALARARWRFAPVIVYVFLGVRMVPPVATLIPLYVLMRDIGLLGSHLAVILIHAVLSVSLVVWMMAAQFKAVPVEIEEAARLDGCSSLRIFLRIALPLAAPGLVAAALLSLIFSWNDFLYAAFLTSSGTKTLSVALLSAYGTKDITWGTMGALAHFSTVPILVIALVLNRYMVQGLTRGVH